ncbi:hypothetical protein BU204_27215 [Actinophytocola xanthii]|uniref:Uncharacterized protein n=1 Tax=Actinophytocola xanthii TaxID=1912961 RepID=A0A1Q8CGK3_9PSEU|nr:hypothetical protein BU204_27215 [Actinophytocola xanthii]
MINDAMFASSRRCAGRAASSQTRVTCDAALEQFGRTYLVQVVRSAELRFRDARAAVSGWG